MSLRGGEIWLESAKPRGCRLFLPPLSGAALRLPAHLSALAGLGYCFCKAIVALPICVCNYEQQAPTVAIAAAGQSLLVEEWSVCVGVGGGELYRVDIDINTNRYLHVCRMSVEIYIQHWLKNYNIKSKFCILAISRKI